MGACCRVLGRGVFLGARYPCTGEEYVVDYEVLCEKLATSPP